MDICKSYGKLGILALGLTALFTHSVRPAAAQRYGEIGGDDVPVYAHSHIYGSAMDIASNGDIYVAVETELTSEDAQYIRIMRSQDGGHTWADWGQIEEPGDVTFFCDCLHIAEGDIDRCFIACDRYAESGSGHVIVGQSPLSSPDGDWTWSEAMTPVPDASICGARLTSDASSYAGFYLYLVAHKTDGEESQIMFARSTDLGATFETPYAVASEALPDEDYLWPDISYGLGGYLHVTWGHRIYAPERDGAVMYRRASSYAGSGIDSWDDLQALGSLSDGYYCFRPHIAASLLSEDVVIAHTRRLDGGPYLGITDPAVFHSTDRGATFLPEVVIPDGLRCVDSIEQQPSTGDWIFGGGFLIDELDEGAAIQRASATDPTSWTPAAYFSDHGNSQGNSINKSMALDPTRDHRLAIVWTLSHYADDDTLCFDAEWLRDPGYPNYAPGFPQDLEFAPLSPPAVVDLDGDGDLEIVFTDEGSFIRALHHDGTPVDGWPRYVPHEPSDGPVAVGALDWSGEMFVVIGTIDGLVAAYTADGNIVDGWPIDTHTGANAYVSIGALGDSYPRTIVIATGTTLTFRNRDGEEPEGAFEYYTMDHTHHAPCAIGDVDGDGIAEIACGPGSRLIVTEMFDPTWSIVELLSSEISDAITLGDLDLDGEVEIIVPTADGTLYAFNEDGNAFPGDWPFESSTDSPLTSAAIGQVMSTFAPEVAVAARDWRVHLLAPDGAQASGFPVQTSDNWYLYGSPVIGTVTGAPDLIVGARDDQIWSWGNLGELNPGWPKDLGEKINLSPAYGDLDLDGLSEVVVLTETQLAILDLNQTLPSDSRIWGMYAHDPQRTGCADCPEYFDPSAAPEVLPGPSALSFAAPSPVLLSDAVHFHFALPSYAALALEVFDIQGRSVRLVEKAEFVAGEHELKWDGRDGRGNAVAAGPYFARLRVRGGGKEHVMTRKVVLIP